MADRPIIFSAPMVRALLAGTKTQTRRVLKPQPKVLKNGIWYRAYPALEPLKWTYLHGDRVAGFAKATYAPGDRLYVREAHYLTDDGDAEAVVYAEDAEAMKDHRETIMAMKDRYKLTDKWAAPHLRLRPSIHMPRWASRLTLTVTDVRVQRLQDISNEDALAEGIQPNGMGWWSGDIGQAGDTPRAAFVLLWNSIHVPGAWAQNPWVVALTFDVHRCNIGNMAGDCNNP